MRCRVAGKVQMVLYRDFVCRNARALNIAGTVQNQDDSSVVIIAEGEEEDLQKLVPLLHKGPFLAKVRDVEVTWFPAEGVFNSFDIIY